MRLIHTADWHLGHTLAGHSRLLEHDRFLSHLLGQLDATDAEGLVIAGDVFDHGHPTASAQKQLFTFLAEARRRRPAMPIVVIGGNHDTAARLDAPAPVLAGLGVTVLGGLPRTTAGELDLERAVVPLRVGNDVAAVVVAVPFLRAPELAAAQASVTTKNDLVIDGTRAVLEQAVALARARFPGLPVVAMAHCELAGARLSTSSERQLFGGRHALPQAVFADVGVDYAALGHLHLAQQLGPDGRARYSGSPLPLSMAERDYEHQVLLVDVETADVRVRPLKVPRAVDLLRVPDNDAGAPLDEVLDRLRAIDLPTRPTEEQPYVDVRVTLDRPVPDLRAQIDAALADKPVRLVAVKRIVVGDGLSLSDAVGGEGAVPGLLELAPVAVFQRLYARQYGNDASAELVRAMRTLVDDENGRERVGREVV
jgi:exonuclease SbcD